MYVPCPGRPFYIIPTSESITTTLARTGEGVHIDYCVLIVHHKICVTPKTRCPYISTGGVESQVEVFVIASTFPINYGSVYSFFSLLLLHKPHTILQQISAQNTDNDAIAERKIMRSI